MKYDEQNYEVSEEEDKNFDWASFLLFIFTLTFFGFMFCIQYMPRIIARQIVKNPKNIKEGCLYFERGMNQSRTGILVRIENYPTMDMFTSYVKGTPFDNKGRRLNFFLNQLKNDPNYCHRVKYVVIDWKIYTETFIYDAF